MQEAIKPLTEKAPAPPPANDAAPPSNGEIGIGSQARNGGAGLGLGFSVQGLELRGLEFTALGFGLLSLIRQKTMPSDGDHSEKRQLAAQQAQEPALNSCCFLSTNLSLDSETDSNGSSWAFNNHSDWLRYTRKPAKEVKSLTP